MEIKWTRKYTINGKEYKSLDEVPEDLRKLVQGVPEQKPGFSFNLNLTIDGKKRKSLEEMTPEERKIFEDKNLNSVQEILAGRDHGKGIPGADNLEIIRSESSGRWWFIVGFLTMAGLLVYWFVR